jgi:uncharacterized protein GlcG (DUF336 family)
MRTHHVLLLALTFYAAHVEAAPLSSTGCPVLPDHARLRGALVQIQKEGKEKNSGVGNHFWAVVVDRDGNVCSVVYSGPDRSAQWPGSRLIAAEKAHTANALSHPDFALSTANLYAATQPGQSLYGLISTAPPNPATAFAGPPEKFGQPDDPLVGKPIGGIVVFGGGLALYDNKGHIVGGLGVSGDTACADHVVAWKVRHLLNLDGVPAGPAQQATDNMILDLDKNGASISGFGHPTCKGGLPPDKIIEALPQQFPALKR